jgi:hypothetical protein
LSAHNDVCLGWLTDTLRQLRQEGRTKAVGYLEAVLEEVVFEMKMSPSRSLPHARRLDPANRVSGVLATSDGVAY